MWAFVAESVLALDRLADPARGRGFRLLSRRVGLAMKPYRIFKFRTMVVDAEKLGLYESTQASDGGATLINRKDFRPREANESA